ncbi:ead/Ea22-like family protein [Enterobacter hormaechei]|uniref:ead/Ea22-like family protein n=1 Tax=Enterobacter hormaechei TaxID=158836 RepID=UPI000B0F1B45|nr:ead/Ea22-like family protein [Enterobacter hormaechei]
MSNIDKHIDNQELRERAESTISILENIAGFEPSDIDGDSVELRFETEDGFDTGCDVSIVDQCQKTADVVRALLDELEAKDKSNSELTEALKQTVSGYKSCLRMGHDRILDLGGDCDSPEVMIAGNPDIQQAEKLIAAAAGKGEAS